MMKAMQAQGIEWGEDYRNAAGAALKEVLQGRMAELGEIELAVPRTRTFSAFFRPVGW